jgi:epoxyqueuosine reductase QueG
MKMDPSALLPELYEADQKKYFDDPAMGPVFDPPFVGVAGAEDPWFARLKELIGEFHWTPQEALALVAPQAQARSVISWCLPVAQVARVTNRRAKQIPSRSWAYVRTFGEEFVTRLRHGVEDRLRALGFAALAPAVAPQCDVQVRPRVGLSSRWSERHVAFVAGLGTLGLSGGLITRRGIAHRLGSVVTSAQIAPTPRPYGDDAFAWCLKLSRGTCGSCIRRCPVGSIGETVAARDKGLCRDHYTGVVSRRGRALFGWEGVYGCGLCQTKVPCEDRNPTE